MSRDLDTVTAVVSWVDIEDIAATIREATAEHLHDATCACPAVEAVARLQELGYTITKAAPDHVRCSRCGGRCSNDVPVELVVRAFVECPECIHDRPEREVRLTLTRGGVVTVDGFGKVLDPGDTYTVTAPADLTIQ